MYASDFHCHRMASLFTDKVTKIQNYARNGTGKCHEVCSHCRKNLGNT